jgi:hypothetical protein
VPALIRKALTPATTNDRNPTHFMTCTMALPQSTASSLRAVAIEREARDVRSSGDSRKRVDAYFVVFDCPPDADNPARHEWVCRFEVPRGAAFTMRDFPDKATAKAAKGYTL